jgi:hypothetical protein
MAERRCMSFAAYCLPRAGHLCNTCKFEFRIACETPKSIGGKIQRKVVREWAEWQGW